MPTKIEWCEVSLDIGEMDKALKMDRKFKAVAMPPYLMYRVGKKAAGRLLDGRTWEEMPK